MFRVKKSLKTRVWFIAPLATRRCLAEKIVAVAGSGNSGLNSAFDFSNTPIIFMCWGKATKKIKGDEFLQEKLKASGKIVL